MFCYLQDQRKDFKINNIIGFEKKVNISVLQSSFHRPLLFNLFINDIPLLLPKTSLSRYADDYCLCSIHKYLEFVKAY